MPKLEENVCCHKYRKVMERMGQCSSIRCITDHPGFKTVVIDKWVLEDEAYEYVAEEGRVGDEMPVNRYF